MRTKCSVLLSTAAAAVLSGLLTLPLSAVAAPQGRRNELGTGKELFETNCSSCHGLDASGGLAPNIQRMPATLGDEATAKIVKGGVPGTAMPAFAGFTDAQINQIVAHLRTLGDAAMGTVSTGDPEKGKAVYDAHGCASCHIINGVGGNLGPDLTTVGNLRPADFIRLQIQNPGGNLPKSPVTGVAVGKWTEYLMFRAVTKDGHVIEGMRAGESTLEILLQDSKGTYHSLHKADLQSLEKEPGKSFMPSYSSLSNADLNNLAAYLGTLKAAP